MAHRPIRVVPAAALREGFEAIRREAGVPTSFPPEVEAEAAPPRGAPRRGERVDLPFVTIDPPGVARPRPGAAHRAPRRRPSRPLRDRRRRRVRRARRRARRARPTPAAVTVYAPDAKAPLHPPVALRGRGEPAARAVAPGGAVDARPRRRRRARPPPRSRAPRSAASPSTPTPTSRRPGAAAARGRGAAAGAGARARRRAARGPRAGGRARGRRLDRPLPRAARDRGPQRAGLAAHRHGGGRS